MRTVNWVGVSQLNVIVIHIAADEAEEYERMFEEEELPLWRQYHADGKFLNARFYRSQFGTDERSDVVKYVIVVEVPGMAEHSAHDSDPEFQDFDRRVDRFQPEQPLVYGGEVVHSVG
jgi:hypothetical protein